MDQRILDAFAYWNRHKAGADFVVVDGSSYTNDDELLPDEFAATDKFTAVRQVGARSETRDLPLWWAEYYVEPADANDDREGWSESRRVAVQATGMIAMVKGGASSGFYWNPETGRAPTAPAACGRRPTGRRRRQKLPMYDLVSRFGARVPAGHAATGRCPSPRTTCPTSGSWPTDTVALVVNTLDRRSARRSTAGGSTCGRTR